MYLRDTLELGRAYVSEACLGAHRTRDVDIGGAAPLRWSGDDIISPFDAPL